MSPRLLALLALVALSACRSTSQETSAPVPPGEQDEGEGSVATPLFPAGTMEDIEQGPVSGINDLRLALIRDDAHWQELWADHASNLLPVPESPSVDFEEWQVVALVLGERTSGGYSVAIESIEATSKGLLIEAHETRPEPGVPTTLALTSPYHFVRIPRAASTEQGLELRLTR